MLTPKQQRPYRTLVQRAWEAHCARDVMGKAMLADKASKESWYRAQLQQALGIHTTKQAHPTHHFAPLMAHFEAIVGDSIYWQGRSATERRRQAQFALRKLARQADVDEDYIRGISAQMHGTRDLARLDGKQLHGVFTALRIHLGRQGRAAAA